VNSLPSIPVPFQWPDPPFNVVLVEPEIPQNTGNIARLCAATGSILHLVGPLGFQLTSSHLKRSGLDYWKSVKLNRYLNWEEFDQSREATGPSRRWYLSTKGRIPYTAAEFRAGDSLVFGSESKGLRADLLKQAGDSVLTVPMQVEHVRSLNLATTAGIVLYEALRQVQARKGRRGLPHSPAGLHNDSRHE